MGSICFDCLAIIVVQTNQVLCWFGLWFTLVMSFGGSAKTMLYPLCGVGLY